MAGTITATRFLAATRISASAQSHQLCAASRGMLATPSVIHLTVVVRLPRYECDTPVAHLLRGGTVYNRQLSLSRSAMRRCVRRDPRWRTTYVTLWQSTYGEDQSTHHDRELP
jgi:hypothetical protein